MSTRRKTVFSSLHLTNTGKQRCLAVLTVLGVIAAASPTHSRAQQQQQQHFPRWSWDTVQLHAHCSNTSASAKWPFRPDVAQWMASLPFVVIEKTQGSRTAPANGSAQDKILAAAAQLRALNASSHVFFYFMTDWTRPAYRLGQWFQERPAYLLRNSTGQVIVRARTHTHAHTHTHTHNTHAECICLNIYMLFADISGAFPRTRTTARLPRARMRYDPGDRTLVE